MWMHRFPAAGAVSLALAALCVSAALAPAGAQAQPPGDERGGAWVRTQTAYPTGTPATSVLLLERYTPAEVRTDTPFEYQIRLTNLTERHIEDVVLAERFPAHFRLLATGPRVEIDRANRRGVWRFESLAPRGTQTIHVRGSTVRAEPLDLCATVTFAEVFCTSVAVVAPELALVKAAPREVLLCDPILLQFVVTNTGTGAVRNVRITDALPRGLATADGTTTLVLDAGDLAAGQSREVSVMVRAAAAGEYTNTAEARDDSGLRAEASATTIVREPILTLTKRGPDLRFVRRPATFEITVENIGDAPARDTILTDVLPPGTELVRADGGRLSGNTVMWNLGTLAPGASATVQLTVNLNQIGTLRNTATAEAVCARATASAAIEVRGIPAILLEVVDGPDPIEIGNNVTYTIEVTNQGSAVGTNIVIDCELPPQMQYVSATGPVSGTTEGRRVRFAPLASLAPKAKATYRIIARGTTEADARFYVKLTSDQTSSPVEESESTHIY